MAILIFYEKDILDLLTSFIKTERLCCSFFNFSLAVRNTDEVLLEITGPMGAKAFITTELGL